MPGLNSAPGGYSGPQMKIDFESQEKLTQERLGVISKYNLIGEPLSKLVKKGDKWYVGDETVEEWEATWSTLNEPDADDNKYGRR